MRNYLLLVTALNIHQSSASCFGKDAHFKTTDVSSLIKAKSGLSLIQFAFSATCGEPDIQDRPQPGVGVLGQDHQETRVCGQVQRLGLAGGDGEEWRDQGGRPGEGEGWQVCGPLQDGERGAVP